MSGFHRLAQQSCTSFAAMLAALDREFGGPTAATFTRDAIAVRAADLPHDLTPACALWRLATIAQSMQCATIAPRILPAEVLAAGSGHPAGITAVLVLMAEVAGYPVEPVIGGERLYLAHRDLPPEIIVDCGDPHYLIEPASLGVELRWACPHELAGVLLRRIACESTSVNAIDRGLAASSLIMALPLDERTKALQGAAHRGLLAKLN